MYENEDIILGKLKSAETSLGEKANKDDFYINVKDYGAKGDGVTDDTTEIQSAIDYVSSQGGGTIFFPSGTYCVRLQSIPTTWNSNNDYSCLCINSNNIYLFGLGNVNIKQIPYSGTNMETDVTILDSKYLRGHMLRLGITGGLTELKNIIIENITFDGNIINPASNPGTATNTDLVNFSGWDTTHKCLFFKSDVVFGNIRIEKCTFKNFRGENIYGGNYYGYENQILKNTFYNTPAGITVSFPCEIAFNTFRNTLYQSIENGGYGGQLIHDNRFYNVYNAIDFRYYGVGYDLLPSKIYNNYINIATNIAICTTACVNTQINNNTIIDSSVSAISIKNGSSYNAENDGISRNVSAINNKIIAHTINIPVGIEIYNGSAIESFTVENNSFERTNNAITNGFFVTAGISCSTTSLSNINQIIKNNKLSGCTNGFDNIASFYIANSTTKKIIQKGFIQNGSGYVISAYKGDIVLRFATLPTSPFTIQIKYCRTDGSTQITETVYTGTPTTYNLIIPFGVYAKMGYTSNTYRIDIEIITTTDDQANFKAIAHSECIPTFDM